MNWSLRAEEFLAARDDLFDIVEAESSLTHRNREKVRCAIWSEFFNVLENDGEFFSAESLRNAAANACFGDWTAALLSTSVTIARQA